MPKLDRIVKRHSLPASNMLRSSLVVFGFLAQTLVIVWLLNPEVGVPGCAEPMMVRVLG